MPALNAFAQKHPDVKVIALTYDSADLAKGFAAKHHFAWNVVYGGQTLVDALGLKVYPTLAVVNPGGTIGAKGNTKTDDSEQRGLPAPPSP